VGCACGGCIIASRGNPEKKESKAVQRLVDLLAIDPSKFCRTVRKVVVEMKGDPKTDYERLRKKYRRLEKRGQLPEPSSSIDQKADAVVAAYHRRIARIEKAQRDLVVAKRAAEALGLDLGNVDIEGLCTLLRNRCSGLKAFLDEDPEVQMNTLISERIFDPQEAAKQLRKSAEEIQLLEQQILAMDEVRRLHRTANLPLSPP
jgi:hypothetical protein